MSSVPQTAVLLDRIDVKDGDDVADCASPGGWSVPK